MKKWTINRTLKWAPSLLRGGLWVGIAVLNAYTAAIQVLTDEQYANMSVRQAHLLWSTVALAGFAAWRTYIDSSHSTNKQKAELNEKPSYVALAASTADDKPPVP